jgi:hypothetical protein
MIDPLRPCCGEAMEVSAHAHATDPYVEEDLAAPLRFENAAGLPLQDAPGSERLSHARN